MGRSAGPGWARWPGPAARAITALVVAAGLGAFGARSSPAPRAALGDPRSGPATSNLLSSRQPSTPVGATTTTVLSDPLSSRQTGTPVSTTTTRALPPLAVLKVSPADKAKAVGPNIPVVVTYNRAPSLGVPRPTISPNAPGHWARGAADQLVFKPTGYWEPGTTYRVLVPAPGGTLAAAIAVVTFTTALPSVLTLQQYLAMLGYLPLRFTPTGDIPNRKAVLQREPTSPNLVPQAPAAAVFTWAYPDIPGSLWAQWHRGHPNVVTTGAVIQFELAQGLGPDGVAGPLVWGAL